MSRDGSEGGPGKPLPFHFGLASPLAQLSFTDNKSSYFSSDTQGNPLPTNVVANRWRLHSQEGGVPHCLHMRHVYQKLIRREISYEHCYDTSCCDAAAASTGWFTKYMPPSFDHTCIKILSLTQQVKDFTIPHMLRFSTLWNINFSFLNTNILLIFSSFSGVVGSLVTVQIDFWPCQ